MSRKKLSMRKVSEVARLKSCGLSNRRIARSCGIARSTVADYLARLDAACLSWPFPPDLTEEALDARLFTGPEFRGPDPRRPVPDWAYNVPKWDEIEQYLEDGSPLKERKGLDVLGNPIVLRSQKQGPCISEATKKILESVVNDVDQEEFWGKYAK